MKHDEHGSHLEIHTPNGIKKVYYKGGGKSNSVGAITGISLGSVVFCEINLLHMAVLDAHPLTGSVYWKNCKANGGEATTFYIKEPGTGNTGWIAK